jgi:hypothetical protein
MTAEGRFIMTKDRLAPSPNELTEAAKPEPVVPRADAIRGAHRVLTVCVPNASLPVDLPKLRAMLDAHMFGRDKREVRDDAVRVARQIDSLRPLRR